jgi:hypothetical protein
MIRGHKAQSNICGEFIPPCPGGGITIELFSQGMNKRVVLLRGGQQLCQFIITTSTMVWLYCNRLAHACGSIADA